MLKWQQFIALQPHLHSILAALITIGNFQYNNAL